MPSQNPETLSKTECIKALTILANVLQHSVTPQVLGAYASVLCLELTKDQFNAAMSKATKTCKYFPRPSEIIEFAGLSQKSMEQAESDSAWITVCEFSDKWVQSDVHGRYVVDSGCRMGKPPQLPDRLSESVRRVGGWQRIKCMRRSGHEDSNGTVVKADYEWVRKEFIEAFNSWEAFKAVPQLGSGLQDQFKQLCGKKMP